MSGGRERGRIEVSRKEWRILQEKLREKKRAEGLEPAATATLPNCVSPYGSIDEETEGRLEAVTEQVKIMRAKLPILLRQLRAIRDPRHPKKIRHRLTCVFIYGILSFVLQMSSRREANREMTRP